MIDRFIQDVLSNRNNRAILSRWDRLSLTDGWLVAGCLFQTIWNLRSGFPPEAQIKDYDLFYFDGDPSESSEHEVQARVERAVSDLGIAVEATNQAYVHRWYEAHFGYPYPRLYSVKDGIDRFLVAETCVGIRPIGDGFEVYAPNGIEAVYEGRLSPNPLTDHRPLFERKARSYRARWPWLAATR